MKNKYSAIPLFIIYLSLWSVVACSGDDDFVTNDRSAFIESITGDWSISEESSIEIDNQDVTDLFRGFEISIDENLNYSTNSEDLELELFIWPSEGNFILNEDLTELTREDGLIIKIDLEADVLDLQFESEEDGGRAGLIGWWRCRFRRR